MSLSASIKSIQDIMRKDVGVDVKTRIKQDLLEKCNLHTIVRLPNGVFSPYTNIKTNLLFFTKGSRAATSVIPQPAVAEFQPQMIRRLNRQFLTF